MKDDETPVIPTGVVAIMMAVMKVLPRVGIKRSVHLFADVPVDDHLCPGPISPNDKERGDRETEPDEFHCCAPSPNRVVRTVKS
jgi:hypothetical protein